MYIVYMYLDSDTYSIIIVQSVIYRVYMHVYNVIIIIHNNI